MFGVGWGWLLVLLFKDDGVGVFSSCVGSVGIPFDFVCDGNVGLFVLGISFGDFRVVSSFGFGVPHFLVEMTLKFGIPVPLKPRQVSL